MQYNIKNILQSGEKVAVHVPTEEEAREVVKITKGPNCWNDYHEDTCINADCMGSTHIDFYKRNKYTIIPASLFIEHNTPKAEKKPFAVKADSFELYEGFVKECDKMGWRLCKAGSSWLRDALHKKYVIGFGHVQKQPKTWSVYNLEHSNPFATHYPLETKYSEALAAAKAWFEGQEVNASPTNAESENVKFWKRTHDDAKKGAVRLQSLLRNTERELSELKTQVKLLLKHNKDQHDRNNAKLMAISILLSSSMAPDNFAVDCIIQYIDELIEKEYDEPGALHF